MVDSKLIAAIAGVAVASVIFNKAKADDDIDTGEVPAFNKLFGVNYISSILRSTSGTPQSQPAEVEKRMKQLKADRFNFIRVPYYWDAYESNKTNYKNEIVNIFKYAQQNGIYGQLDFHQHKAGPGGDDFPKRYTSMYPIVRDASGNNIWKESAVPFWQGLITNTIPNQNIWADMLQVQKEIVTPVLDNPNFIGVEICNEAQIPPPDGTSRLPDAASVHAAWGKTNTYIGSGLRSYMGTAGASKYILICEGNGIPLFKNSVKAHHYRIFPTTVKNLAYGFHRYAMDGIHAEMAPRTTFEAWSSNPVGRVNNLMLELKAKGVDIFDSKTNSFRVGCQEWAVGTPSGDFEGSPNTYTSTLDFLRELKGGGFGWAYWAAFGTSLGDGRVLYTTSSNTTTGWKLNNAGSLDVPEAGEGVNLQAARKVVYGTNLGVA